MLIVEYAAEERKEVEDFVVAVRVFSARITQPMHIVGQDGHHLYYVLFAVEHDMHPLDEDGQYYTQQNG